MARTARNSSKTKASARSAKAPPRRRTTASGKTTAGRRATASAALEEPRRAARPAAKRRPVLAGMRKARRVQARVGGGGPDGLSMTTPGESGFPAPRRKGGAGGPGGPPATTLSEGEFISPELSDEERIESAKYLPRHAPKRLFEEERFLFPETYGTNRVRLLVKDPEWLFAHWDVDQRSLTTLRRDVGERALALARLTLRLADPGHGGSSVILLPPGVRGWYVRADRAPRSYRAELGLTLPSGEFRVLATSNVVTTPRVGPAQGRARRRMHYRADAGAVAAAGTPARSTARPGPLPAARLDGGEDLGSATQSKPGRKGSRRGGASDVYRR